MFGTGGVEVNYHVWLVNDDKVFNKLKLRSSVDINNVIIGMIIMRVKLFLHLIKLCLLLQVESSQVAVNQLHLLMFQKYVC